MDIISSVLTMSGRIRLINKLILLIPFDIKIPITRSASRIDGTSGVTTTIASFALVIAFKKPSSIPAGLSIKI
jgi:hypothetical protein